MLTDSITSGAHILDFLPLSAHAGKLGKASSFMVHVAKSVDVATGAFCDFPDFLKFVAYA